MFARGQIQKWAVPQSYNVDKTVTETQDTGVMLTLDTGLDNKTAALTTSRPDTQIEDVDRQTKQPLV